MNAKQAIAIGEEIAVRHAAVVTAMMNECGASVEQALKAMQAAESDAIKGVSVLDLE